MTELAAFQAAAFQQIFKGLKGHTVAENINAFATAICLTDDTRIEGLASSPKQRVMMVRYFELLKGNAITRLYYAGETTLRVERDTSRKIDGFGRIISFLEGKE